MLFKKSLPSYDLYKQVESIYRHACTSGKVTDFPYTTLTSDEREYLETCFRPKMVIDSIDDNRVNCFNGLHVYKVKICGTLFYVVTITFNHASIYDPTCKFRTSVYVSSGKTKNVQSVKFPFVNGVPISYGDVYYEHTDIGVYIGELTCTFDKDTKNVQKNTLFYTMSCEDIQNSVFSTKKQSLAYCIYKLCLKHIKNDVQNWDTWVSNAATSVVA